MAEGAFYNSHPVASLHCHLVSLHDRSVLPRCSPSAPLLLPLKRPWSLSRSKTVISNPRLGVYVHIYLDINHEPMPEFQLGVASGALLCIADFNRCPFACTLLFFTQPIRLSMRNLIPCLRAYLLISCQLLHPYAVAVCLRLLLSLKAVSSAAFGVLAHWHIP
jgi:hypothetical protein